MYRLTISAAVTALVLAAGTSVAQQKGPEDKAGPPAQGAPEHKAEPKGAAGKGAAQNSESKNQGTAQKHVEAKDRAALGQS